ncbi:hypothetical protein ACE6H2_011775 [Prunus campanulata]
MSETRPVPRRESPWGRPEGDHREPKAHRCNDRAEDVIQLIVIRERALQMLACGSCRINLKQHSHSSKTSKRIFS